MKRMSLGLLCVFFMTSSCYAEDIDVFWLAEKGTPKHLEEAVQQGAKFNVKRSYMDFEDPDDMNTDGWLFEDGETPLHRAAMYNHTPESIRFLISQGLDVNAVGGGAGNASNYGTPLSLAIKNNSIEVVKELLKAGADPNAWCQYFNFSGNMFKLAADTYGKKIPVYKSIVEALIEAGGNVNAYDDTKPEEMKPVLLPRNQWESPDFRDNMKDDLSLAETRAFPETCTALTFAVFSDNPDVVNVLLDVSADVSVRNMEGKAALDYANDLPEDSKLKQSPVFERLKAATGTIAVEPIVQKAEVTKDEKKFGARTPDKPSEEQLGKLINDGKIPAYVGDKGVFFYNPEFWIVGITGTNVRLRSQPNTKARIVDQISTDDADKWPGYLGEWISPQGERWILANYSKIKSDMGNAMPVWIWGEYADPMTEETYWLVIDDMAEAFVGRELSDEEFTALCAHGSLQEITDALTAGANVNAHVKWGGLDVTPLMAAAMQNTPEVVSALLNAGADTSVRNRFGETARDIAKSGNPRVVGLLEAVEKKATKSNPSSKSEFLASLPSFTLDEIATQIVKNPRKFRKEWENKEILVRGKVDTIEENVPIVFAGKNINASCIKMKFSGHVTEVSQEGF